MTLRDEIASLVAQAVARAQEEGRLSPLALPEVGLERPPRPELGDYATSLPLRLARAARSDPLAIAQLLAGHIPPSEAIAAVEVAPPGFLNFRLSDAWLARQVEAILAAGPRYGDLDLGRGQRVQVEFVSANPVGPLHVGNGRWAVVGSTLARVLAAAGYQVEREYYINDLGSQIETFGRTLYARYQQLAGRPVELPAEGYPGHYVVELAQKIRGEHGDAFLGAAEEPPPALTALGIERMLAGIREDLLALGVGYDVWFRESSLHGPQGPYERAMALLRQEGYVAEREGALWFTSTALGEDKDNVLVRSDGSPTYFASDIAYHYDKLRGRGFQRVVDIWGADHQGHVPRMQAAVAALGVEAERLTILLGQLVTLRRGGEVVRISKRSGDIITLREVVEEAGRDACRFFFLARSLDAAMDFDLELAQRQSKENPVYYVQYGHARMAGILALAREQGIDYGQGDPARLGHPAELALLRQMLRLPEVVEGVARSLAPHHLPYYALELATAFHDFYEKCRVVGDDGELTRARLRLVAAARLALARTLELMGMAAPERM